MIKGKPKTDPETAAASSKENPQVNARIDEFIKSNPKQWSYIQSLPRERLERSLILNEIQKQDRVEKMRAGVLRKLDANPEMKQSIEAMVKYMPAEQRERAMVSIARQTMRGTAPRQTPTPAGAKV